MNNNINTHPADQEGSPTLERDESLDLDGLELIASAEFNRECVIDKALDFISFIDREFETLELMFDFDESRTEATVFSFWEGEEIHKFGTLSEERLNTLTESDLDAFFTVLNLMIL